MTRRFMDANAKASDLQLLSACQISIGRRLRFHANAEHHALLHDGVVEESVGRMEMNRQRAECLAHGADAGDVVDVGVCEQYCREIELVGTGARDQRRRALAWIDRDGFPRVSAGEEKRVFVEGWRGEGCQEHCGLPIGSRIGW
jgi:hypothetical protein